MILPNFSQLSLWPRRLRIKRYHARFHAIIVKYIYIFIFVQYLLDACETYMTVPVIIFPIFSCLMHICGCDNLPNIYLQDACKTYVTVAVIIFPVSTLSLLWINSKLSPGSNLNSSLPPTTRN